MDPVLRDTGLDLLSRSRALRTWKQCGSALSCVGRVEAEFNLDLSIPWSSPQLLNFLAGCRRMDLKFATVSCYLSQVRTAHQLAGHVFSCENLVSRYMLKAFKNVEEPSARMRRLAVTPRLLLTIKHRLRQSQLKAHDRLMLWTVCTWAFFGSFRVGELLADQVNSIMDTSLTGERISWGGSEGSRWIKVSLLNPKESRTREFVTVELLELIHSPQLCPVKAFWDWRLKSSKTIPLEAGEAVFRFPSGKNLTPQLFNKYLKILLCEDMAYGLVTSHSFRAGMGVNVREFMWIRIDNNVFQAL